MQDWQKILPDYHLQTPASEIKSYSGMTKQYKDIYIIKV